MSAGKYFLDTNIFIYSFDEKHSEKRKKSMALIRDALHHDRGLISYQVVQEFIASASRLFAKTLTYTDINDYMETVLFPLCAVYPQEELYRMAVDIMHRNRLSFYDALIIAGAAKSGCKVLYSEDLNHGQVIAGIKIQNPFS